MDWKNITSAKNFYLLIALLSYFLFSPFIINNHTIDFAFTLLLCLAILITVNIVSRNKLTHNASWFFAYMTLLCYFTIIAFGPMRLLFIIYFILVTLFFLSMTIAVIFTVAKEHVITLNTLLGSICGYLMMGLTWTYVYLTIAHINPQAFSYHLEGTMRDSIQHFIYYSYTTLTTLGYGDIVAKTDLARSISWLEAATGQIYLAVWISQLVALHIAQRIKSDNLN